MKSEATNQIGIIYRAWYLRVAYSVPLDFDRTELSDVRHDSRLSHWWHGARPGNTKQSHFRDSYETLSMGIRWRWLHGGYTVQNPVLVATWWLHEAQREKARYRLNSELSFVYLGWLMGLEPTTTGITILTFLYFTVLIIVVRININQQVKAKALDK